MAKLTNLFYFCLGFCVVVSAKGGEYEKIHRSGYRSPASYKSEVTKNDLNPTEAIVTECVTPNEELGYCIEIKRCRKLMDQIANPEAASFIRASQCGPSNQNVYNPKVCCGTYSNYRETNINIDTQTTAEDEEDIFPKSCGRQNVTFDRRIVGGTEALLGEYPWMARLIHKSESGSKIAGCSGFLIHPNFVLTAAHCTHPFLAEARGPVDFVELGEHNTGTDIDCSRDGTLCAKPNQIRRVANVVNHPDFNPEDTAYYNDIAIIHLKRAAQTTNFVQPICLLNDDIAAPSRYYLSGWGKTEKELHSQIKMKVEVPPFDKEKCKKKFYLRNMLIKDTQICAGGAEKDSCSGDSGGPLMMVGDDDTWYASGIVSFGISCGIEGWPAIYTNILKFMPWIKSEMMLNMSNNFKNRRSSGKERY